MRIFFLCKRAKKEGKIGAKRKSWEVGGRNYFNYIGKFENEVTQLAEPTEQEIRQMREEIEEAKKEKSRAYHRQYSREYRARNLEKQREYDRMKAREYRARRKAQAAAAQPTQ